MNVCELVKLGEDERIELGEGVDSVYDEAGVPEVGLVVSRKLKHL